MRLRRRNLPWLAALGAMIAVAALSGTIAVSASLFLVALYVVAFLISTVELRPAQLIEPARASLSGARVSPEAREAADRARRRGAVFGGPTLADVGMVVTQAGPEGIDMQRTRSITGDADGARPYVTLRVSAADADRSALVRFELIDQNGEQRFVHEQRAYLRDGEVNVLADHHLPLAKSAQPLPMGDWDLRVYVDNKLIGMHSFTLSPSVRDRFRYLEEGSDAQRAPALRDSAARLSIDEDDRPVSLEDLLRSQSRRDDSARRQNGTSGGDES